tara:strand:+ start:471 stop:1055 length:585 start_codon:yes stop_codon:yes gene_type:complete
MAMTEEEMRAFFEVDQEQSKGQGRGGGRGNDKGRGQGGVNQPNLGQSDLPLKPPVEPDAFQQMAGENARQRAASKKRQALMKNLADSLQEYSSENPLGGLIESAGRKYYGDERFVDMVQNKTPLKRMVDSTAGKVSRLGAPSAYDILQSLGLMSTYPTSSESIQKTLDQIKAEEEVAGQKAYDDYISGLTGGSQ